MKLNYEQHELDSTSILMDKQALRSSTHLVPGTVKLRPFRTREVSCPPTMATGDIDVSSGALQALQVLDRRIFPVKHTNYIVI